MKRLFKYEVFLPVSITEINFFSLNFVLTKITEAVKRSVWCSLHIKNLLLENSKILFNWMGGGAKKKESPNTKS